MHLKNKQLYFLACQYKKEWWKLLLCIMRRVALKNAFLYNYQLKGPYYCMLILGFISVVFSVSTGTCLHALMFKKLFIFLLLLCCSISFHPLSETRAQSALIGSVVIGQPLRDVLPLSLSRTMYKSARQYTLILLITQNALFTFLVTL